MWPLLQTLSAHHTVTRPYHCHGLLGFGYWVLPATLPPRKGQCPRKRERGLPTGGKDLEQYWAEGGGRKAQRKDGTQAPLNSEVHRPSRPSKGIKEKWTSTAATPGLHQPETLLLPTTLPAARLPCILKQTSGVAPETMTAASRVGGGEKGWLPQGCRIQSRSSSCSRAYVKHGIRVKQSN